MLLLRCNTLHNITQTINLSYSCSLQISVLSVCRPSLSCYIAMSETDILEHANKGCGLMVCLIMLSYDRSSNLTFR
jgi:hypothetical protein